MDNRPPALKLFDWRTGVARFTPLPNDVVAVALPILRHRLILNFAAQSEGVTVDEVVNNLIRNAAKADKFASSGDEGFNEDIAPQVVRH